MSEMQILAGNVKVNSHAFHFRSCPISANRVTEEERCDSMGRPEWKFSNKHAPFSTVFKIHNF